MIQGRSFLDAGRAELVDTGDSFEPRELFSDFTTLAGAGFRSM
jgi:hypothetical protein